MRPDAPPLIIDASNICRDDRLAPCGKPAAWSRLTQFIDAMEASDVAYSKVYLVADTNLMSRLDEPDRRAFRQLESAGEAERQTFADERMVELAFVSTSDLRGALIATHDFFDDFRRRYPEIDQATGVGWEPDRQGLPIPVLRSFGSRTHQRVSRKEEESELRERKLRREEVQHRAAATQFRCTNGECWVAKLWPERLEELPKYDERADTFVCPNSACGHVLEVGVERGPTAQVIVYMDDVEQFRMLLEDGLDVGVGRVDARDCIGLERHLSKDRVKLISRRHLQLSLKGDRVSVVDLGSKNGTLIGGRTVPPQDRQRLPPETPTAWRVRDALFLPGGISLERSGRRLPLTGDRPRSTAPTNPESPPTTLATPGDRN